jgi:hypothetical protein
LQPVGFALPSRVTPDAVRSYRTISPLPEELVIELLIANCGLLIGSKHRPKSVISIKQSAISNSS